MSDFSQRIEEAITAQEEALTADLRKKLGRSDIVVEFDRSSILLSPEKSPARRWPEDFRGFGSNVRPKKQR